MTQDASPKRRYLALFFPLLSADRWLRESSVEDQQPRAFIAKSKNAVRIMAANEAALALGIGPGLALADARARVPDLEAVPYDAEGDAALLERIADDCDRYTPSVALDPPAGLILDITGCAHIWDGEAGLVSDIAARLAQRGFTLKLAIAETPDKARALAQHGGELLSAGHGTPPSQVNEERAAYRIALPIAALDLEEEQASALRRAGLYTIDDLACRPRKPLAARFGMEMVAKLVRVLGEEDIRIQPRRVPPPVFALRRFAEPVAHTETALETIAALADEAGDALRERGEGGRLFAISLFRSDGDIRRLGIETGAPSRDSALLVRLFRERIDSLSDPLDPGFGYDTIRLDVAVVEAHAPEQTGLQREPGKDQAEALIDRLGVRLGQGRVRRFSSGNSHIPELAGFTMPVSAPALPFPWVHAEPSEPPLRPLRLFDPPQPIEVIAEVPDGPPRTFRWRRQMHNVVLHEGPERIAAEWWRRKGGYQPGKGGLTRDYYRVEDSEGRRFWLFRHGLYGAETAQPGWYLHGRFA